eukprot:711044_1
MEMNEAQKGDFLEWCKKWNKKDLRRILPIDRRNIPKDECARHLARVWGVDENTPNLRDVLVNHDLNTFVELSTGTKGAAVIERQEGEVRKSPRFNKQRIVDLSHESNDNPSNKSDDNSSNEPKTIPSNELHTSKHNNTNNLTNNDDLINAPEDHDSKQITPPDEHPNSASKHSTIDLTHDTELERQAGTDSNPDVSPSPPDILSVSTSRVTIPTKRDNTKQDKDELDEDDTLIKKLTERVFMCRNQAPDGMWQTEAVGQWDWSDDVWWINTWRDRPTSTIVMPQAVNQIDWNQDAMIGNTIMYAKRKQSDRTTRPYALDPRLLFDVIVPNQDQYNGLIPDWYCMRPHHHYRKDQQSDNKMYELKMQFGVIKCIHKPLTFDEALTLIREPNSNRHFLLINLEYVFDPPDQLYINANGRDEWIPVLPPNDKYELIHEVAKDWDHPLFNNQLKTKDITIRIASVYVNWNQLKQFRNPHKFCRWLHGSTINIPQWLWGPEDTHWEWNSDTRRQFDYNPFNDEGIDDYKEYYESQTQNTQSDAKQNEKEQKEEQYITKQSQNEKEQTIDNTNDDAQQKTNELIKRMHLKDYFEQQKEELDTHMKEQQRKFEQKFIEQKAKENELKMRENKLKEQERDMQSLLFKDIETTQQQTPSQQNKRRKVSFDTSGSTQPISKYSPFLTTQQLTQSIRRPSSNTLFKVSTATTKQTYQPKGLNTSLNTGYPVHPDSYLNDNDEDEDDDEDDDNDTNNYSQMRNINHRDINPNLNANQNNDSPNNNQDNNRQNGHQNNNKRGDDGTGDHGDHDGNGGDGRSGDNRRQSDGNDGFPPPNNAFETFIMSQTQAMKDLSEEIKKGRNGNGDNKWKSTHRIKCMESIKIRFNGNP